MMASDKMEVNGMDREARKDQILKELEAESDRGCILVAASALDVFLEELLKTRLVADQHTLKYAVRALFEPMGPLATFSAKIKLAYGLGLISRTDFTDLEKIRRIRNIASHEYSAMTFESQEIIEISRTLDSADRAVEHLPVSDKKANTNPQKSAPKPQAKVSMERMRFILTVSWVAGRLDFKSEYFESNPQSRHG
jgi:DNA-binding MltR family transcriptional regulator